MEALICPRVHSVPRHLPLAISLNKMGKKYFPEYVFRGCEASFQPMQVFMVHKVNADGQSRLYHQLGTFAVHLNSLKLVNRDSSTLKKSSVPQLCYSS